MAWPLCAACAVKKMLTHSLRALDEAGCHDLFSDAIGYGTCIGLFLYPIASFPLQVKFAITSIINRDLSTTPKMFLNAKVVFVVSLCSMHIKTKCFNKAVMLLKRDYKVYESGLFSAQCYCSRMGVVFF